MMFHFASLLEPRDTQVRSQRPYCPMDTSLQCRYLMQLVLKHTEPGATLWKTFLLLDV